MNGAYDPIEPTSLNVPNWDTGWGSAPASVTGWDYVGSIAGTSGVYLGNGWVLTAAHVGASTFILDSGPGAGTYTPSGVTHSFSNSDGTVDLTLFQLKTSPSSLTLPSLALATADPNQFLYTSIGSKTVMIGFGDGGTLGPGGTNLFKTWGYDTVDLANEELKVPFGNTNYFSNDFITVNGTVHNNTTSSTNNSQLVSGDSGGGDFIYNSALGQWQLAGINEATGTAVLEQYATKWYLVDQATPGATNAQNISLSAYVQLDTYQSQINAIVDAPEPPVWLLALGGVAALGVVESLRRRTPIPAPV